MGREIDDEVWVPAIVVSVGGDAAGQPQHCKIRYEDGSTEDLVLLDEIRRPSVDRGLEPPPEPGPGPEPGTEPEPPLEPGSGPEPGPGPGAGAGADSQRSRSPAARAAPERHLSSHPRAAGRGQAPVIPGLLSPRWNVLRVIGSSAKLEESWQQYRSQHDVMGDRLLTFGVNIPGLWAAAAEAAGGVMADLMEGVVLPTPRVPIAPENTSQLLSEALQAEREARQRGFVASTKHCGCCLPRRRLRLWARRLPEGAGRRQQQPGARSCRCCQSGSSQYFHRCWKSSWLAKAT